MTFIDLQFGIFLLAGMVLFFLCPVKHRWKMLLAMSIVFYAIAGVKYLPFIFVTSFSVFWGGRKMGQIYTQLDEALLQEGLERKEKKNLKEQAKAECRKIMLWVLIANLVILCIVKFTRFFVNPINDLVAFMGGTGSFSAADIIVPLGISYYTFSALSYLLDLYWKRVEYEKDYFRFLLYLIYFPHILQGPIEHYGRLGQRLKQELRFDYDRVCKGLQLMLYGYFKKLVIADRINTFITTAYGNYENTSGSILLIAMFLDVVYIYADFSGCMDMVRGMSQIFGIEMDLNFNHPFSAKSVTEFWRRWHMTMGGWFREYVYTPVSTSSLVKNVSKKTREKLPQQLSRSITTAIPVTITWVLTGLWHGTGKTYVAWGLYYSLMIFLSVSFGDALHNLMVKWKVRTETESYHLFQMIRTTCIFAIGRLLTRPGSLRQSWYILKASVTRFDVFGLLNGGILQQGMGRKDLLIAAVCILIFGCISILQLKLEADGKGGVRELIAQQNLPVRWGIYIAALFLVMLLGVYGPGYDASAFVYMAY